MRLHLLLLFCLFLLHGTAAAAETDAECTALSKLFRVVKALHIGRLAETDQQAIPAINAIAVDVVSIDAATLNNTFRETLEDDHRAVLARFIDKTQNILLTAYEGDLPGAVADIQSDAMKLLLADTSSILKSFECVDTEAVPSMTALNEDPTVSGDLGEEVVTSDIESGPTAKETFIAVGAMLAVIGAAAAAWRIFYLRKRRGRRYELYYVVRWRAKGATDDGREGVIKDINCYGVRLDIADPPEIGVAGEIKLSGTWHPCRIQWSREDCCGIRLDKRIRVARVLLILRESRKISRLEPNKAT